MNELSRAAIALSCIAFTILLIQGWALYPQYSLSEALFTAFLRLLVPVLTIAVTYTFHRGMWKQKWLASLTILVWILLIPYGLYNVTQVRHVAELCRLPEGYFFAGNCHDSLWMLLPILAYSLGSLAIFLYSVKRVSSLLKPPFQRVLALSVFAYAAFATVIGISSRLDTLSIFLNFPATIAALRLAIYDTHFWINVFAFFLFATLSYYVDETLISKSRRIS